MRTKEGRDAGREERKEGREEGKNKEGRNSSNNTNNNNHNHDNDDNNNNNNNNKMPKAYQGWVSLFFCPFEMHFHMCVYKRKLDHDCCPDLQFFMFASRLLCQSLLWSCLLRRLAKFADEIKEGLVRKAQQRWGHEVVFFVFPEQPKASWSCTACFSNNLRQESKPPRRHQATKQPTNPIHPTTNPSSKPSTKSWES